MRTRQLLEMFFLYSLWVVLFAPNLASAHTLAEVLNQPSAFDQQEINVTGQVANVTTRYGETVSTTFAIRDAHGDFLSILVSGVPNCKQGEICKVSGLFVAQRQLILPEKIERVAERPFESAGVLFRQRRTSNPGSGGRAFRDVYIPELGQQ
ncbi:MAG: hypothetical protein AB7P69_15740 [Candidatus Binatia bacterium]